jgi:hypothetical protein
LEEDVNLLDSHRIVPGEDGGKYTRYNTVTCCAKCHRKIHSGRIQIIGKHPCGGRHVVIYMEDGEEKTCWA